jgi:hypothetical protein
MPGSAVRIIIKQEGKEGKNINLRQLFVVCKHLQGIEVLQWQK